MRKLGKEHIADTALEREELAPGAGEVIYAADGDVLKDMQAQQDDPYAWLEKQLDLAENTGAEVPTIQDALKRHVPIPDSVADEDSAEDSSDLGTSSSSSSRARASNQPGSDWREEQVPTRQVLTFTCFTGTKVQILTHYLTRERARRCARETRWAAGGVRWQEGKKKVARQKMQAWEGRAAKRASGTLYERKKSVWYFISAYFFRTVYLNVAPLCALILTFFLMVLQAGFSGRGAERGRRAWRSSRI
jgi:hypothetical protein